MNELLAVAILILAFIVFRIWSIRTFSNEKFNNFKNWQSLIINTTFRDIKQNILSTGPVKLEDSEQLVTYFYYVRNPATLTNIGDVFFLQIALLTNKRIILSRSFFPHKQIKYKSIAFSEIKDAEAHYLMGQGDIKIILHTGEVYQICRPISQVGILMRLFAGRQGGSYKEAISFFKDKEYLKT